MSVAWAPPGGHNLFPTSLQTVMRSHYAMRNSSLRGQCWQHGPSKKLCQPVLSSRQNGLETASFSTLIPCPLPGWAVKEITASEGAVGKHTHTRLSTLFMRGSSPSLSAFSGMCMLRMGACWYADPAPKHPSSASVPTASVAQEKGLLVPALPETMLSYSQPTMHEQTKLLK